MPPDASQRRPRYATLISKIRFGLILLAEAAGFFFLDVYRRFAKTPIRRGRLKAKFPVRACGGRRPRTPGGRRLAGGTRRRACGWVELEFFDLILACPTDKRKSEAPSPRTPLRPDKPYFYTRNRAPLGPCRRFCAQACK